MKSEQNWIEVWIAWQIFEYSFFWWKNTPKNRRFRLVSYLTRPSRNDRKSVGIQFFWMKFKSIFMESIFLLPIFFQIKDKIKLCTSVRRELNDWECSNARITSVCLWRLRLKYPSLDKDLKTHIFQCMFFTSFTPSRGSFLSETPCDELCKNSRMWLNFLQQQPLVCVIGIIHFL
jgi:hypothetical protein